MPEARVCPAEVAATRTWRRTGQKGPMCQKQRLRVIFQNAWRQSSWFTLSVLRRALDPTSRPVAQNRGATGRILARRRPPRRPCGNRPLKPRGDHLAELRSGPLEHREVSGVGDEDRRLVL